MRADEAKDVSQDLSKWMAVISADPEGKSAVYVCIYFLFPQIHYKTFFNLIYPHALVLGKFGPSLI